mmetsp:Transcript_16765/g.43529  ORF Transcript_16765/g.43529 Transcript_16765/m.43529 type:complete len:206 (-) Transcript_16765:97-714(-)
MSCWSSLRSTFPASLIERAARGLQSSRSRSWWVFHSEPTVSTPRATATKRAADASSTAYCGSYTVIVAAVPATDPLPSWAAADRPSMHTGEENPAYEPFEAAGTTALLLPMLSTKTAAAPQYAAASTMAEKRQGPRMKSTAAPASDGPFVMLATLLFRSGPQPPVLGAAQTVRSCGAPPAPICSIPQYSLHFAHSVEIPPSCVWI